MYVESGARLGTLKVLAQYRTAEDNQSMRVRSRLTCLVSALIVAGSFPGASAPAQQLENTAPLLLEGDLAEKMVAGMHLDVDGRIATARDGRYHVWHFRRSSPKESGQN